MNLIQTAPPAERSWQPNPAADPSGTRPEGPKITQRGRLGFVARGIAALPAGTGGPVRLGLSLGYQTSWTTPADHLAMAREADRLGDSVVWAAEADGSDSPSMLAWM